MTAKDQSSTPSGYPYRQLENGYREYTIKQQKFVLPPKYMPMQKLGSGSYGLVISAKDGEKGDKVAIKRCGNVFKHCEDGKRVLREIKMMSMLDHRNVLPVTDAFVTATTFDDVYVVTPCLDTDLAQIIKSHRLTDTHIKYIMYQILRGLKYVHSANILHRDLKPANILLNFDCHVKLCDFGLARGYDPLDKQDMTSYIVTRWYRAPELLLSNTNYNGAIDIWAAGCIFAELLTGKPLFPGDSSVDQLKLICDSVPVPEWDELRWVQSTKSRQFLASKAGKDVAIGKDVKSMLGNKVNPLALDMLLKMLTFSPLQRWNADLLLDHPFIAEVRSNRHCQPALHRFKWRWDSVNNLTEPQLRQLFWQELVRFHPDCKFAPHNIRPASPVAIEVFGNDITNTRRRDENSQQGSTVIAPAARREGSFVHDIAKEERALTKKGA